MEKVHGAVYRHKRSAIIFPSTMVFRFRMDAGNVTLNLEKAARPSAPIYIIEESGITLKNQIFKVSRSR